jgi:hypothetical protein
MACKILFFPFFTSASTEGNRSNPPNGHNVAALHGFQMLTCMRTAPRSINHNIINQDHWLPAQQTGKDHMPLPVFQPLKASRHLLKEIHLVSVELRLLLVYLRKIHTLSDLYVSNTF